MEFTEYKNTKGEMVKQTKLNGKTLSKIDMKTGQVTYLRYKIKVNSDLYEREAKGPRGTFKSLSFYGYLDGNSESIQFQMGENAKKTFEFAKVNKGDDIEVFGKPYVNKKTGALMAVMGIDNLTKGVSNSKSEEEKPTLKLKFKPTEQETKLLTEWNNLDIDDEDNTFENFKITANDDERFKDISDDRLKKLWELE